MHQLFEYQLYKILGLKTDDKCGLIRPQLSKIIFGQRGDDVKISRRYKF